MFGIWSQQAENMADSVGANSPEAANALYRASSILLDKAKERTAEFQSHQATP